MNTKIYLILILLVSVAIGIYLGNVFKNQNMIPIEKCSSDSECSWEITSCCPEVAGAKWQCVNLNYYKKPNCPTAVICPQVISPKPTNSCICVDGSCKEE